MKAKTFALSLLMIPSLAWTAPDSYAPPIQPIEAIQLAATAAPNGVPGTFAVHVRATGHKDGLVYLNSELDYRDQRCLTIVLTPDVARALRSRLGADPSSALKDKNVLVTGEATRVTVWLTRGKRRTDKYYYQTHVTVTESSQLQVLPAEG